MCHNSHCCIKIIQSALIYYNKAGHLEIAPIQESEEMLLLPKPA